MAQFLLSCESTVEYMHSRGIPVIFYSYIVDEQAYPDDMVLSIASLMATTTASSIRSSRSSIASIRLVRSSR